MSQSEVSEKKILVTMIGAKNAIDTKYAFFDNNGENAYRKKNDGEDGDKEEKYGYPFWAKLKTMTKEEKFDQIVFIGTEASKWESLLSNAEKLAGRSQNDKDSSKKNAIGSIEKSYNAEILEQMNRYVGQFIGTEYNSITEKDLPKIEGYIKELLTPDEIKQEKEKERQELENQRQKIENQRHIKYVREHLKEHLHEYEKKLGENITLALKISDPEMSAIEVKVILIKEGRTENENRENVITIQRELASIPISEITLDVTNGLRSHPMYVLSIINNISAIGNKGIPVNIYYGMFDAKLKAQEKSKENNYVVPVNSREGEVAPLVDLKEIQTMDKWTRAISEFFSNGSVLRIIELLDDIRKEIGNTNHGEIDNYINAFENFSLAVNSNNLLIFEEAIKKMELIKNNNIENSKIPEYIQICLNQIILHIWKQFRTEDVEEQTKYSFYMFALANWYLQQNRLGDSVRTFQEAVITYVMEKFPEKISKLLEKRMIQWSFKNNRVSDVMFDAKVRKVIRDAVFEDDFEIEGREKEYKDWAEWMQEYQYMKTHIHNPDALLYNLDQKGQNAAIDSNAPGGNDMKYAKDIVQRFAKKMPGRRLSEAETDYSIVKYNKFEERIDYLLDIRYYDVFISYRRSYHSDKGHSLNDGVLLVTALADYFRAKGLKVFVDKNRMRGVQGEFSRHLQQNLRNSKLCLIVLGKNAYARDFADTDEYYKEIITAVQTNMKIAVICMEDFYKNGKKINYGKGVTNQKELMKVVKNLQRVGSEYADLWKYENILSLRKCAYEEMKKMLEEE